MQYELSSTDKQYIWSVVLAEAESTGSYQALIAQRKAFLEESGRIRAHWPGWMLRIRRRLKLSYGESSANQLMPAVWQEVSNEQNYSSQCEQLAQQNCEASQIEPQLSSA